jgi:CheY-like chemotaxis protein
MVDPHQRRHRILFVDDDPQFLEVISQLFLQWTKNAWEVLLAANTARALAFLQEKQVDVVVMDIRMPVMDGLQFLKLVQQRYAAVHKVVLTGFANDEYRRTCLTSGAELFLEKPRTKEGFDTVFATLNELASLQPQEGFRGMLRQVGLQDVIQMECLGRNSVVLEVSNAQLDGRIYIEKGDIVHAEAGVFKGTDAFNRLLCLRGGDFNLRPFLEPKERTIEGSWEFLVMDAAQRRDEIAGQTAFFVRPPAEAPKPAADESVVPEADAPDPNALVVASAPSEPIAVDWDTQIEEFLVGSAQGEVLYEWQCTDAAGRLKLLNYLAQKAEQIGRGLPLGKFSRLEVTGFQGRLVAHLTPDRRLLVRSNLVPPRLDLGGAPA